MSIIEIDFSWVSMEETVTRTDGGWPIIDNKFSIELYDAFNLGHHTYQGTFTSSTSASGSWSGFFSLYQPGSLFPPQLSSSGTWTANSKAVPALLGDVNGDGKVRIDDAILALRIAAGLMDPTQQQRLAADMNGDGEIRSNDAMLILRKVVGLTAPDADAVASGGRHITISLPEAHGMAGENVTIPLKADNLDALAGGDICISYDPKVLRAVDVLHDSDILLAGNIAEPGIVRISFAGDAKLKRHILAEIKFDILMDDVSTLKLNEVDLYRPDALPIGSSKIDGHFGSWAIPPKKNALLQNFPNPFNPETWIPYQLRDGSEITIRIYSGKGVLVRELVLGYKSAGFYVSRDRAAYWNGKNEAGEEAASGIYFYSITAGEFSSVKKMVIKK